MIASDFNDVMRLVYVAYFHATEVVLLLKLGGNEVFFDINRQKKFIGFVQPPSGTSDGEPIFKTVIYYLFFIL
jgi:hypothetical protein